MRCSTDGRGFLIGLLQHSTGFPQNLGTLKCWRTADPAEYHPKLHRDRILINNDLPCGHPATPC